MTVPPGDGVVERCGRDEDDDESDQISKLPSEMKECNKRSTEVTKADKQRGGRGYWSILKIGVAWRDEMMVSP